MGMMTLDQSLANLVRKKMVNYEDALAKAKDRAEFDRIVNMK